MAPGNSYSNIIIRSGDGSSTGDRWIQTADGQVWKVVDHQPYPASGDRQGTTDGVRVE